MNSTTNSTSQDIKLDLWKYFNDRMNHLKDVLLQVLSWLLAFALAIVGFMVQKDMVTFKKCLFAVAPDNVYAVATFSILGILLCWYCFYLIHAYGVLINESWMAAGRVRDELEILNEICLEDRDLKASRIAYQNWLASERKFRFIKNIVFLPPFCIKIGIPVIVFLVIFGWVLVNAVC